MKRALATIAIAGLALTGCSKKSTVSTAAPNDLTPPPAVATYTPAPAPQPVQPVQYEPIASSIDSAPTPAIGGNTYTIKPKDTLYSIAKAKYGNGKDWQKIVSANPGLNPSKLRVGQTITLP